MKIPKININWKELGTKALAIGGGLAAIWLAVKPKDEPLMVFYPDVPDEADDIEEVEAEKLTDQEEETEEEKPAEEEEV